MILLITYNFIVRLLTQCHIPFPCLTPPATFSVKAKRIAIIGEMCASPQSDSQPSPFRFYHHVGLFPWVWQQETHGNKQLAFQEQGMFEKHFFFWCLFWENVSLLLGYGIWRTIFSFFRVSVLLIQLVCIISCAMV